MREFSSYKSLRNGIWMTVLSVAVLALSGPFGTFDRFNLGERVLYWSAAMLAGTLFIHFSVAMAIKLAPRTMRGIYGGAIVGTIFGSVPAAALIMIIHEWFTGTDLPIAGYPLLWSNVALVGCIVSCAHVFAQYGNNRSDNSDTPTEQADKTPEAQTIPLMSRLPDGILPHQIVSFSMQDHYVEVTSVEGQSLL